MSEVKWEQEYLSNGYQITRLTVEGGPIMQKHLPSGVVHVILGHPRYDFYFAEILPDKMIQASLEKEAVEWLATHKKGQIK